MNPAMEAGPTGLEIFGKRALTLGIAASAACAIGAFMSPAQFFRSYLFAYVFWLGLSIGSLSIVMLHHLSGGAWGIVLRRLLESGTRPLPLMAILFLPLLFGLKDLYIWARPDVVAADEILRHKAAYLNVPFFVVRAVVYFAAWSAIAHLLYRWSREQDQTKDPALLRKFQLFSAPGIVAVVLTVTFASVDWMMSLEPHWFSTIYGLLVLVGWVLAAFAFAIVMALWLSQRGFLAETLSAVHFHDLGKLLFTFVMVWAYLAFSQFIITYAGNLPEEVPWYLRRMQGGWGVLGIGIALLQFGLPFFLLLGRSTKQNLPLLMRTALLLVFMRLVDLFWMTAPALHEGGLSVHWLDLAAPLALGGLWLSVFVRGLSRLPLLPIGDPALQEALQHE